MPLVGGLCHAADFDQMWSEHVTLDGGFCFAMEFDHIWINNVLMVLVHSSYPVPKQTSFAMILLSLMLPWGRTCPKYVMKKSGIRVPFMGSLKSFQSVLGSQSVGMSSPWMRLASIVVLSLM